MTIDRADVLTANSVEQAIEYEQSDFYLPGQRGVIHWEDVVPVRDIVVGRHIGREDDD